MTDWHADFRWGHQYLPRAKELIGARFLIQTPDLVDQKQAADLMILETIRDMAKVTIGVRIRRAEEYLVRFATDFTIRSQRDSGAMTELAKIQAGWADWFFYGYGHADGFLAPWWLFNLAEVRAAWASGLRGSSQPNGDGTHFHVFRIADYRSALIAAADDVTAIEALRRVVAADDYRRAARSIGLSEQHDLRRVDPAALADLWTELLRQPSSRQIGRPHEFKANGGSLLRPTADVRTAPAARPVRPRQ